MRVSIVFRFFMSVFRMPNVVGIKYISWSRVSSDSMFLSGSSGFNLWLVRSSRSDSCIRVVVWKRFFVCEFIML